MTTHIKNRAWKDLNPFLLSFFLFIFVGGEAAVDASEEFQEMTAQEEYSNTAGEKCEACGQVYCTDDCPYWNPEIEDPECAACVENTCCEVVEYVDYTPWDQGGDVGLYCLPGTHRTYSCPTVPEGSQIYRNEGRLIHKYRYPSEYTPEKWNLVMMHMRVILPMTACDYRKVLSFVQAKEFKPKKSRLQNQQTVVNATDEKPAPAEQDAGQNALEADTVDGELSLEGMIGAVPTEEIEMSDISFQPSLDEGGHGKIDTMVTGFITAQYQSPANSIWGDFNGNDSFSYIYVPIALARFGDSVLMATKLALTNFGQRPTVVVPYSYLAYFYNDYLTLQFGKLIIPFGVYPAWYIGWIDKSASPPLARTFFEGYDICPTVDIGFEAKGAIPLCCLGNCFKDASFTYELWVGNGPSEVINPFTFGIDLSSFGFDGQFPSGTINYNTGQGNSPNNNNELTYGARLGFLPNYSNVFGISYMRGRWNGNKAGFGLFNSGKLYFEGAAFDWSMNIGRYTTFRGEYIWTLYENSNQPASPFSSFNSAIERDWVRQQFYWAELAFNLGILECVCPSVYCCNPCLWDSLELVLRSDAVWAQKSGRSTFLFDYSGFEKRRFSLTLGYYFTQSFTAKLGYDFNWGEKALNTTYTAFTGSTKERGFAKNVFTFRITYGW